MPPQQQPMLKLRPDQISMAQPQDAQRNSLPPQSFPQVPAPQAALPPQAMFQQPSSLPPPVPQQPRRTDPIRGSKPAMATKITQGPKGADESVILPGGGNLNFESAAKNNAQRGLLANQQHDQNEYLNAWQSQIKEKEDARRREREDRVRRERQELQE